MLTIVSVAVAVASVVFIITMAAAAENETRVIQRDAGLNVRIIPAEENLDRYWARGWAESTMPQEYIERVAEQSVANRLIPLLHKRISWNGTEAMLTGIAAETFSARKMKAVFGMEVQPGQLHVGSIVASALQLERGDTVDLLGEPFVVEEVLIQGGTFDDTRVYANLADVQRLLGLEGRINEIQALECNCSDFEADPLTRLKTGLEPLLPGARIIRHESMAQARIRQRSTARRFAVMGTPVITSLCAVWIGALAMINVRERKTEIGLLQAIGFGAPAVAGLFIGRSLLLGCLGAAMGFLLGALLAETVGPDVFRVTAASIQADITLLFWTALLAPLLAAAASLIPAALGATQDPSAALRPE